MKALVSVLFVLAAGGPLFGATLTVDDDGPADYNNIQAAVTAATPGDTVSLADGVYTGPGNRAIDFGGKAITLKGVNGPARAVRALASGGLKYLQSGLAQGYLVLMVLGSALLLGWLMR